MCDAFAVLTATENFLINQSKLTPRNAAKDALSYIMRCFKTSLVKTIKTEGQKVVLSNFFLWYFLIITLYVLLCTLGGVRGISY